MSSLLFIRAYWQLIHFDLYLGRGNFRALYEEVRNYPVRTAAPSPMPSSESVRTSISPVFGIGNRCCASNGRRPQHACSKTMACTPRW